MPVIGTIIGAIVAGVQAAAAAFAALSAFAQLAISVTISLAASFITNLLAPRSGTDVETAKVNVRISEPVRWLIAGEVRQGGGVLFAEFDSSGNLWYVVVHSDSILSKNLGYFLDDVRVQLDTQGNVITNEFCLTPDFDPYEGVGQRVTYFNIQTTTYTADNPTPPQIQALRAAFPSLWTAEHKLVGTTYTVVKVNSLPVEERFKIYRWRGALGLGEPAIGLVGEWTKAYDPRDPSQSLNNPSTYKFTRNSVLIWAWFRTHPFGRNKSLDSVNWQKVGEQATICDETVVGIESTQRRYECAAAIPEDRERNLSEQDILMTCDAIIMFDDVGKAWPRVGKYQTPNVTIYRNRDIISMEAVDNSNIEDQKQGVIMRYYDRDANYAIQPSSPWRNPEYYRPGEAASYLTLDAIFCPNHNQAVRLAKIIGMRSQSAHRLGPTVGMRGLNVRNERVINVLYDNEYSGEYEVVTPVQVDPNGILWGFGCVPIDPDRYDLLPGEELSNASLTGGVTTSESAPITLSNFTVSATRSIINAFFDVPTRTDLTAQVQYALEGSNQYVNMTVTTSIGRAFSGNVPNGRYGVRHRTVTGGGAVSVWTNAPNVVLVNNTI